MITKLQAQRAGHGATIYSIDDRNADGTAARWRINGACKTWKTRPLDFKLPVKHGLYAYGYITHDNAHRFTLEEPAK